VPEIEAHANRYFLDLHRHLADSARAEIEKLQVEAGTNFPLTIGETGVADALADAAQDCEADLIVIGRGKARKTLGRFRTHAYDIIRHAPCPVLSCAFAAQQYPRHTEKIAHVEEEEQLATTL
jgi:nucleotide-binding universal stress UspA family protein